MIKIRFLNCISCQDGQNGADITCTCNVVNTGIYDLTIAYITMWVIHLSTLSIERTDPIVFPGQSNIGHAHTIVGGSAFGPKLLPSVAKKSKCTTADNTADKTNYWAPQLYFKDNTTEQYSLVKLNIVNAYYQHRARNAHGSQDKDGNPVGTSIFPKGLKMIAGNSARRTFNGTLGEKAINYACLGGNLNGEPNGFPTKNCPGGLRAQCRFPSCWNGVAHFSKAGIAANLRYPSQVDNGNCPTTHPHNFMSIFQEYVYETQKFDISNGQFVWANGDTTGYGFHCDFLNGWNTKVLTGAIKQCIKGQRQESCPPLVPTIVNGPHKTCKLEVPHLSEKVGEQGPIPNLLISK